MIPALVALVLLPVLAYQFLPSFRHRMGFVRYDFGYYSKMEYREGSSDGFHIIHCFRVVTILHNSH